MVRTVIVPEVPGSVRGDLWRFVAILGDFVQFWAISA